MKSLLCKSPPLAARLLHTNLFCLVVLLYDDCSTGRDELLETAMALHDVAMKDDYFVSRKLAPNVDFWRFAHFLFISSVVLSS